VFRKVKQDLDDKGVPISEVELRKTMADLLAAAVRTIEAEAKNRSAS
jgi:hypothetical protein